MQYEPKTLAGHKFHGTACFDSLSQVADFIEPHADTDPHVREWGKERLLGGLRCGDQSMVAASDTIMADLEDLVAFPSSRFETRACIAGGAVNVPAHLSGNPMSMRRRETVISEIAPIHLVIWISSSGSVSNKVIERRGAACLALARILSAVRPISLYVGTGYVDQKFHTVTLARLDTAPLDLARAAFALAHPAMLRGAFFAAEHIVRRQNGHKGGLSMGYPIPTRLRREAPAALLNAEEYVFSPRLDDEGPFKDDDGASEWIKSHVAAHLPEA